MEKEVIGEQRQNGFKRGSGKMGPFNEKRKGNQRGGQKKKFNSL